MSDLAELDRAADHRALVNYIHNDGAEIFNYTGGPGSTEVKTAAIPIRTRW